MKAIIFGATGMVGQSALRECLLDTSISSVLTIGRTPTKNQNAKLQELVHLDLYNYEAVKNRMTGYDVCFFCLGTPSQGKSEAEYSRITYDMTMAAAKQLVELNPKMTFIYISGEGSDSTEKGPVMWARVRGRLENDLFKLAFKAVYVFRPGIILPMHGIQSKTRLYRLLYQATMPLLIIMRRLFPNYISSTEQLGKALIKVAEFGYEKKILNSKDFEKITKFSVKI